MKNGVPLIVAIALGVILIYHLATHDDRVLSKVIGATAVCNDGSVSTSPRGKGVCSSHGGVRQWVEK